MRAPDLSNRLRGNLPHPENNRVPPGIPGGAREAWARSP